MENAFKAITKGGDDRAKARARDFVDRVTTGDPLQGFSDEEVRESAAILKQLSPGSASAPWRHRCRRENQYVGERSILAERDAQAAPGRTGHGGYHAFWRERATGEFRWRTGRRWPR